MDNTIDKLQIELTTESKSASTELTKVKTVLQKIKAISEKSGINKITQELRELSSVKFSNLKALNKTLDKIGTASKNMNSRRLETFTKSLEQLDNIKLDKGIPYARKELEGLTHLDFSNLQPLSDVLGRLDLKGKNTSERIRKLNEEIAQLKASEGGPSSAPVSPNIPSTGLKPSVSGVDRENRKVFSSTRLIKSGYDKAKASVDRLKASVASTKKHSISLGQLFKQVVMFGGAFRLFSMATMGVSEGLKNIAQYSDETSGNMDKLSTMSLKLKNSIGTALYPVIVALTPALQTVTEVIAGALNIFNMFISALQGKDMYLIFRVNLYKLTNNITHKFFAEVKWVYKLKTITFKLPVTVIEIVVFTGQTRSVINYCFANVAVLGVKTIWDRRNCLSEYDISRFSVSPIC